MLSQSNLNLFPQALYVYNVSNGGLTKVKDRCVWNRHEQKSESTGCITLHRLGQLNYLVVV